MGKTGGASYTQASTGSKMPSLNNNLSELDTLLQDLSNARYNAHYQERGWLFRLLILSRTVNLLPRAKFLGNLYFFKFFFKMSQAFSRIKSHKCDRTNDVLFFNQSSFNTIWAKFKFAISLDRIERQWLRRQLMKLCWNLL